MGRNFLLLLMTLFFGVSGFCGDIEKGAFPKSFIKIVSDNEFGVGVNWDELLYKGINSVSFTKKGEFFVVPTGKHFIYKFDKNGRLIKKFGVKGRGPGDLYLPTVLPIVDDKYLMVVDYTTNNKITVFTQKGDFVRVIKTSVPPFKCIFLNNNCFAFTARKRSLKYYKEEVFLMNVSTSTTTKLTEFNHKLPEQKIGKSRMMFTAGDYGLACYLHRAGKGNLLVGFNGSRNIEIYSAEGKQLKVIPLNIKRQKLSDKMRDHYYKSMIGDKWPKQMIKDLKNSNVLPEYTPYYKRLLIDSKDNLLVFGFNEDFYSKHRKFQRYSAEGKYLGSSMIDFGKYKREDFAKMIFWNEALYGLFRLDNDKMNDPYRFIKVKLIKGYNNQK